MSHPSRAESVMHRLKEQGCRITPQRLAVVRVLVGATDHPTVEQVFDRVHGEHPTISLATVYKIVHLLRDLGEIRELGLQGDRTRYDGFTAEPHPHVICLRCRAVADADIPDWGRFVRDAEEHSGYQIVAQRLEFFGFCDSCRNEDLPPV